MLKQLLLGSLLASSFSALANWQIDADTSRVNFVSVKKNTLGESHYFKAMSGSLSEQGELKVEIDLTSVETNIPIRNTRMQEMLFNTQKFAVMSLTANVQNELNKLKTNTPMQFTTSASMQLHGVKKEISLNVMATKLSNGAIQVVSLMPTIITPSDFNLEQGVDALQKIAGLPSITRAVPVSFVLNLTK